MIATGESHSVRDFCEEAFAHVGLDYRRYVKQDRELFGPVDITETCGDACKARDLLGWVLRIAFPELVRTMVDVQTERVRSGVLS